MKKQNINRFYQTILLVSVFVFSFLVQISHFFVAENNIKSKCKGVHLLSKYDSYIVNDYDHATHHDLFFEESEVENDFVYHYLSSLFQSHLKFLLKFNVSNHHQDFYVFHKIPIYILYQQMKSFIV